MLMMSPGLALFLYGVSSIPGEGGIGHAKVLLPGLGGLALIAAFVVYSFRPKHPLLDLRLFKNRNLTVSIMTMFIFAAAFFGGLLLVPQFLQQVQGESPLDAGWLVASQGFGAMLTMPIAGALTDKHPGRADRAVRAAAHHRRHVHADPDPGRLRALGLHHPGDVRDGSGHGRAR